MNIVSLENQKTTNRESSNKKIKENYMKKHLLKYILKIIFV